MKIFYDRSFTLQITQRGIKEKPQLLKIVS